MVALHARRSHSAVAAWVAERPGQALVVTLTGTDVYRDVPARDADALDSIAAADRIVVLQADAVDHVPRAAASRARVVHQSARTLTPFAHKSRDRLHCLLVAHLRGEKDPRTLFDAWRRVPHADATLTIVGAPLDESLADAARALASGDARVRYLGARPHAWVRQAIKRAHVLVVPSRIEGGANVVVEAVTSGTAVLASRAPGNVGMLGGDYPGLFDVGDVAALAALVARTYDDRGFLRDLERRCAAIAPRFSPKAERTALLRVLDEALRLAAGRIVTSTDRTKVPP